MGKQTDTWMLPRLYLSNIGRGEDERWFKMVAVTSTALIIFTFRGKEEMK